MMKTNIGVVGLSVHFPKNIRRNDFWYEHYPDVIRAAEEKGMAKIFSPIKKDIIEHPFERAMTPYLKDPFRGTVERRYLGEDEDGIDLEHQAILKLLAAVNLNAKAIDCLICCSVIQRTFPGNAAYLADRLGLRGTGWNMESACASGIPALQTASSLIATGQYSNVVIVISCNYSKVIDNTDSHLWFMGDGAAAFLVTRTNDQGELIAFKSINTASTCRSFFTRLEADAEGNANLKIRAYPEVGKVLRDTSDVCLRECCLGVCATAGVNLRDIDLFVFNTPTAWYAQFGTDVLGVSSEKTISTYANFGNTGPALTPTNLYYAARLGKIGKGDLVLCYSIGSASTAGACIMRWGDVKLGEDPNIALLRTDPSPNR
jgi:3-oxoacyl-[acyl-carrier-protein] synthase III